MKNKKKLIIILSSVTGTVILLAIALAACANMHLQSPLTDDETSTDTLEISQQNSPEESEEPSDDTNTVTAPVSNEPDETQAGTESNSDETGGGEAESDEAVASLSFTSNGNGTCSVSGIGTVTDSYVSIPLQSPNGDVVISIDEKAFFGNKTLKAVDIPSTVSDIGDMAFSDCPELIYISVNDGNKAFSDVGGILYSADMSRILAYPAANGASSIVIPVSVKSISPMAFYDCNMLKVISFEGTMEEWSKITVGDMNYGLYYTSIICTDTDK